MQHAVLRAGLLALMLPVALLPALLHAQAGGRFVWQSEQGGFARSQVSTREMNYPTQPLPASARINANQANGFAQIHVDTSETAHHIWLENHLHGPAQMKVALTQQQNLRSSTPLPATVHVPARSRLLVTQLSSASQHQASSFQLQLQATPGLAMQTITMPVYLYPLQLPHVQLGQGFGGRFSHLDEENYYAVDFTAPVGTPVLAARNGVVMQVEESFSHAGVGTPSHREQANFVRILHDDGSMAVYAHLAQNRVHVRSGQRVTKGQHIADSGNTGYSSAPHLHFSVQINQGMKLVSIPFEMSGPQGALRFQTPR